MKNRAHEGKARERESRIVMRRMERRDHPAQQGAGYGYGYGYEYENGNLSRDRRQAFVSASRPAGAREERMSASRPFRANEEMMSVERPFRAGEDMMSAEDPEEAARELRRRRRELKKRQRARAVRRAKILAVVAVSAVLALAFAGTLVVQRAWAKSTISDSVIKYRKTVAKYAGTEDISDYVDTLLAIMMVESAGKGQDVMQSSESKGLAPNSLEPEESIKQACVYYAALLDIADRMEIKDDDAIIQAYNFGPGYLEYLEKNGKKHKQDLAIKYAKKMSGGKKLRYLHMYAIRKNGGWIYGFGNMFYAELVNKYL